MGYDVNKVREQFPILDRQVQGRKLVYLDNGATSQTPRRVVDSIVGGYEHTKANVHRGVHTLSQEATDRQEPCAPQGARLHKRSQRAGGYIHTRNHRGHQPRGRESG